MAGDAGEDINWLEDITLLQEDGHAGGLRPYSNCFIKIHFPIPPGRETRSLARVLIKHLQSGNSYGHPPQGASLQVPAARARALGGGVADSRTDWEPGARGWEPPLH
jgi:hypothetical protein